MMLRITKRLDALSENQRNKIWRTERLGGLFGKTIGIIGVGHIGLEIARRARVFGMRVIGCRRHATPSDLVEMVSPERLGYLLSEADFVVLALPLTAETRGLIGLEQLRQMRKDAWLINIARGAIIREGELLIALKEGIVRGACLDVFEVEPLPPESELWSMDNVFLTSHNSAVPVGFERATEIFLDHLRRFIRNEPLLPESRA